jgi:two-component system, LuxR family, sensor kinase FixL
MIDAIDRPQFRSPDGGAERGQPIRILLVEDESAHVRIAQRAFEARDPSTFELRSAESIAAARQAIETQSPDLVIADVILPDGRGLDLIGPAENQKYGVVIMTAQGDEETAVEALKRGAMDYRRGPAEG